MNFLNLWISLTTMAATPDSLAESQMVMCKNGSIVRTLEFQLDKSKRECSTIYTKAGVDRRIGWGQNPNTCREVLNQLKTKLEKNSWRCKDVSTNVVSENGK